MGETKARGRAEDKQFGFFFKFFFFPLISKFLLILFKRKNTPMPPTCPLLQLLQAFKGRKLRDV